MYPVNQYIYTYYNEVSKKCNVLNTFQGDLFKEAARLNATTLCADGSYIRYKNSYSMYSTQ